MKRSHARLIARSALVLFAAPLGAQPFDSALILSLSSLDRARDDRELVERSQDQRLAQDRQPVPNAAFRFERPIVVAAGGPHRLAIDVPLMVGGNAFRVFSSVPAGTDRAGRDTVATATGGLTDLRLYDASGREVAYLLVPNPPVEPTWRSAIAILPVAPVETEKEKTSGFEADLGGLVMIDRFRISGLSPPYARR